MTKIKTETTYVLTKEQLETKLAEALGINLTGSKPKFKSKAIYRFEWDDDPRMPGNIQIFDGIEFTVIYE